MDEWRRLDGDNRFKRKNGQYDCREQRARMRNLVPVTRIGFFVISIAAFWVGAALVLWWAYDFGAFVNGGAYTQQAAQTWVLEFAGIISAIVGFVWAASMNRKNWRDLPALRIGWKVVWLTGVGLLLYGTIILARRNFLWLQGRGQDDWAMFFGSVNATFFSETGPLSFFLEVLPAASFLSALLFVAQAACMQRFGRMAHGQENRVDRQLRLVEQATKGQFENLECPDCGHSTVSVWFTNPRTDEYRTWFICGNCKFHTRVHNGAKPANFTEDRVNSELERRDESILQAAVFKRPE